MSLVPRFVYELPREADDSRNQSFWSILSSCVRSALMTLCVRRIDSRRLWDAPTPEETWLANDALRADALRDLLTEENRLSVWAVDEGSGVPLSRILAAIAAKRENLAKLDFILFESVVLEDLEIASEKIAGDTFDNGVNSCHLDMVHLSAKKLSEFGARIRSAGQVKRYADKAVGKLIRESIEREFISLAQLKPGLAKRVGG